MRPTESKKRLTSIFLLFYLALSTLTAHSESEAETRSSADTRTQQSFPAVPDDLTRVYYADVGNRLVPLPFETGLIPINVYSVARDDKRFEIELNGSRATTRLKNSNPSFYVFVADRMDPPPHLLVRLRSKKDSRRFTITTIKGRKGYAPLYEDNIRLDYRILERLLVEAGRGRVLFVNYMEIKPRQRLEPGEYAIIGDSLADIATFSVE